MTYIDQSLGRNEQLLARAHLPWLYKAAAWLALVLGLLAAGGLLLAENERVPAILSACAIAGLGIAAFFAIIVPVWAIEIGVTNQRLIVKRGFLGRRTEELELWSVEEVDLEQGPIDRLLGFGRLIVSGTGDDDMRLPLIADALSFRKALQQAINDARPDHRSG